MSDQPSLRRLQSDANHLEVVAGHAHGRVEALEETLAIHSERVRSTKEALTAAKAAAKAADQAASTARTRYDAAIRPEGEVVSQTRVHAGSAAGRGAGTGA